MQPAAEKSSHTPLSLAIFCVILDQEADMAEN